MCHSVQRPLLGHLVQQRECHKFCCAVPSHQSWEGLLRVLKWHTQLLAQGMTKSQRPCHAPIIEPGLGEAQSGLMAHTHDKIGAPDSALGMRAVGRAR